MSARNVWFSAAILLVAMSPIFADGIDEAEAKRRGVPIQQVQLEKEQSKNAELRKQITKLQADLKAAQEEAARAKTQMAVAAGALDSLKASITPAQQKAVSTKAAADQKLSQDIEAAITEGRLIAGMTVSEADRALKTQGGETGADQEGTKEYQWRIYEGPRRDGKRPLLLQIYAARVRDGKILSYSLSARQ